MKISPSNICAVVLLLGACGRKPHSDQPPLRPLSQRQDNAGESTADLQQPTAKELTDSEIRRRVLLENAGGMRHMWLSSVASLKGQLFGSFFLDAWEEMEKSNRSQREKEEMEMGLRIEHDRSGAEYHADMAMLVDLAVTPDTAVLKKEAHVLFDKWTDRFPQGPGPVPTKDDLEQLGREAKALFDQTKKLPRISREQLEAEIAALPPIPGQKGTPMYVR